MTFKANGLKAVRIIDKATDIAIGIFLCLALLFGGYSLWDSNLVYQEADAAEYAVFRPEEEGPGFAELRRANPEVIAWLTVNDTPIDYPVTQADDNDKYINTNAKGEYALSGSIFLDHRNSPHFDDFNSIIYGHHMEKKRMFGALSDFSDQEYFDSHPYGGLYFDGKDHGLEFFAIVLTDAYDGALFSPVGTGGEARQAYLDRILARAVCARELSVDTEDRIIVLSTCTSAITNGRYMLFGKLTDELHPPEQRPAARGPYLTVQPAHGWRLPVGLWLTILAILILLLARLEKKHGRHGARKERKSNL